ncbi:MAG: proline dehydrogenase family protein [Rhizomicrobium sp.]
MKEGRAYEKEGYRYSFDMLGEAAYTAHDAKRYAQSYRDALTAIAAAHPKDGRSIFERPSISVKLSALHPRYEWIKHERVMTELLPLVVALGEQAKANDLALTIDAEESDRHDLMLDFFEAVGEAGALKGWNGLGLAVQAYQKRALPTLTWLTDLARRQQRRIPVRLVKGAYWDTEIKRGQEQGLIDYPVFTRKAATDTSYIACARIMLAAQDAIYPQFATHNAHTVAAIDTLAGNRTDFEYQRLHGMGEALHDLYRDIRKGVGTRIYAPVGSHEDLLAYLVRRLLENGANTSFVNRLADDEAPVDDIIADPVTSLSKEAPLRNPRIPLPADLLPGRKNSAGFVWADPAKSEPMIAAMKTSLETLPTAGPIVSGKETGKNLHDVFDPSDRSRLIGKVAEVTEADVSNALDAACRAQDDWDALKGNARRRYTGTRRQSFRGQQRASYGAGRARGRKDPAKRAR